MCSDQDLRNCGFDPAEVRQLENELAEMGLGLGISIGGIFGGIGKAIGKVGSRAFKIGKGIVKTAVPIAASFVPGGSQVLSLLPGGGGPPPPGYTYGPPTRTDPYGALVPTGGYPAPIGYPMPTSYPTPPPAPSMFGAAGMPPWLLPALLGFGALMVLK
jgi:hypothetical protein